MKREAYVVIGSNFGDEGKGLMTDYFCEELLNRGHKEVLNVRFNGGAQAGHTVVRGGKRKVFHIIGSGSLLNTEEIKRVHTYYTEHCIINSVYDEYSEFEQSGGVLGSVYANEKCRITTVWEAELNTMREIARGDKRHGSCGMGIFETIKRDKEVKFRVNDLFKNKDYVRVTCKLIQDYFRKNVEESDIGELMKEKEHNRFEELVSEKFLNEYVNTITDRFKSRIVKVTDENGLIGVFTGVVFEGAQGLMLDQNNREYFPHLTPSNTGIINTLPTLSKGNFDDIHVCYVTRSYMTRHGAGRLDNEVQSNKELGEQVEDKTNVINDFQGSLRFGKMRLSDVINRGIYDFEQCHSLKRKVNFELAITHLDQTNEKIKDINGDVNIDLDEMKSVLDGLYLSRGENAENIERVDWR